MEEFDPDNIFKLSDQDKATVALVLNIAEKQLDDSYPLREGGTFYRQYYRYHNEPELRKEILYGSSHSTSAKASYTWEIFECMVLIPLFNFFRMETGVLQDERGKKVRCLKPVKIQKTKWMKDAKEKCKYCVTIAREIIQKQMIESVPITKFEAWDFVIGLDRLKEKNYEQFQYPGPAELERRFVKLTQNWNGKDKIDWLSWKNILNEKFKGLSNPEKAVQTLDEEKISKSITRSMNQINSECKKNDILTKIISYKNEKKGGIVRIENFLSQDFLPCLKYVFDKEQKFFELQRNGDKRFVRVASSVQKLSLQYNSNHAAKHVEGALANLFEKQIMDKMNILCGDLHKKQCTIIDEESGIPGEGLKVLGEYQPIRILAYCITRDFDKSFGSHQDKNANLVSNDHPAYQMLIPTLVLHIGMEDLEIGCESKPAKLKIQIKNGTKFKDLVTIATPHNSLHLQLFGNQENLFHTVKPLGMYDRVNKYFRLVITGRRSIKLVNEQDFYQPPSQVAFTNKMFHQPEEESQQNQSCTTSTTPNKRKQSTKANVAKRRRVTSTTSEADLESGKQTSIEVKTKEKCNHDQDNSTAMQNDIILSSRMKGFHFLTRWEIHKILVEKGILVEVEVPNMNKALQNKKIKEGKSVLDAMKAHGITEAFEAEFQAYVDELIKSNVHGTAKISHGPLFKGDRSFYQPGDLIDLNEFKSLVNIEKRPGQVIASDENLAIGLLMKHEERNPGMKTAESEIGQNREQKEQLDCMGGGGAASLRMDNAPNLKAPIDGSYGSFASPQLIGKYPNNILQKMWELGRPLHIAVLSAHKEKSKVTYLGQYYIDSMLGHAGRNGWEYKDNKFDDKKKATFLLSKHYEFQLKPLRMNLPKGEWRKIAVRADEKFSFGVIAPLGFSLNIGTDNCIVEKDLIEKFHEEDGMIDYLTKERRGNENLHFNGKQIKLVTPWKIECSYKQLLIMSCMVNVAACLRYTTKDKGIDERWHEYLHGCCNRCLPSANRMFDATLIFAALKVQKLFKSKCEVKATEERYPLKRIHINDLPQDKRLLLKSVIFFIYFVRITGDVKALSVLFKDGVPFSENQTTLKKKWENILVQLDKYTKTFISKQWGKSLGENLGKEHVKTRMNALIDQLTDVKLDEILHSFKAFVDFVNNCVVTSVQQEVKRQKEGFIACLVASDLAEFVDGLWGGEEIKAKDYTAGYGGKQGLSVLNIDLETLFQTVKDTENQKPFCGLILKCLGFEWVKRGSRYEIRSIVNGRLLSVSDIEHFCCKLYLFLENTFGGRQLAEIAKKVNYAHPISDDLEQNIQSEFGSFLYEQAKTVIDAFEKLIKTEEWKQKEYQIPCPQ